MKNMLKSQCANSKYIAVQLDLKLFIMRLEVTIFKRILLVQYTVYYAYVINTNYIKNMY